MNYVADDRSARKRFKLLPRPVKIFAALLLLAIAFALGIWISHEQAKPEGERVSYFEFYDLIHEGEVSKNVVIMERVRRDYVSFVDRRDMKQKWTYFEQVPASIPVMSRSDWLDLHGHEVKIKSDTLLSVVKFFDELTLTIPLDEQPPLYIGVAFFVTLTSGVALAVLLLLTLRQRKPQN